MSRSKATAVPMMGTGCTGARDEDDTRRSVPDSPNCSKHNKDAVAIVGCSSNMTTGSRSITPTVTDAIRALPICKRFMDIATTRKRGSTETISRLVCVTSIRILRSGVRRKSHAPFWNSGRRSDPPIDCNRLNATFQEHLAPLARRCRALARQTVTLYEGMFLVGTVYNFCTPHASLSQAQPMTPAMAAGITDHCWTLHELLSFHVPMPRWAPPKRRGRPSRALLGLIERWCA